MVDTLLDQMRGATREALSQYRQLAGGDQLPASTVRSALQQMTPDDLDMLAQEYGHDQVLHLIRYAAGGTHGKQSA